MGLTALEDWGAGSRPWCWEELTWPRLQTRQADNQRTIGSGWTCPLLGPPSPTGASLAVGIRMVPTSQPVPLARSRGGRVARTKP